MERPRARVRGRGHGNGRNGATDAREAYAGGRVMGNGEKMDAAQVKALASGDPEVLNTWIVTCTMEMRKALEDIPEQIACAISEQRKRDFKLVATLATLVATVISLVTPYILRSF